MISTYKHKRLTWIDLESPTKDEISHLSETYDIPDLVADELMTRSSRSKVDVYGNLIYLILHFPNAVSPGNNKDDEKEIDFVIGHDFIITTHYEGIEPLAQFAEFFDSNSRRSKELVGDHGGFLFYEMIKEFYKKLEHELGLLDGELRTIEENIFEGKEELMVESISVTNRKLLDFKQAIRFHREILKSFEQAGEAFFGAGFSYYLSAISGEYNKVQNIMDGHKEILNDLRQTNDSLLTTKTNETIKKLTILTFIMLPLTLITSIFGMNSDIVFIRNAGDFLTVLAVMGILGIVMFIYFKGKKWL